MVHVGGDEVNFGPWEKSVKTQEFMKENGLKSPADLRYISPINCQIALMAKADA